MANNGWHHRVADTLEERFGLLDPVGSRKYRTQPVFQEPQGKAPRSRSKATPLTAIGLTCGIGSMLVGARDLGFHIIGNVEWRDYYRFRATPDSDSTFPYNFPGAWMARGLQDVPDELLPEPGSITFAAGHPECLPPATPVYTSTGYRPISSIEVGDLVLTHKGKFRRVVKTHENKADKKTQIVRIMTSDKKGQQKAPHEFLTLTGNHPVLTARGWTNAKDVVPGDVVYRAALPCPTCGKPSPLHNGFCSTSCGNKAQWANATEGDRERMLGNCHARVREKAADGTHHFYDDGVRSNAMRALSAGRNGSNLERIMKWGIDQLGLPEPTPQYNEGKYYIDFAYLDHKLAIECDGVAWHKDKEKERTRDAFLESKGWTVLHFEEADIRENAIGCAEVVKRVLANHEGQYSFIPVEVKAVKLYNWKRDRKVYNLTVEDDSSYIAKGFVVHNCGRYSQLSFSVGGDYRSGRAGDASDIPLFLKLVARLKPRFFLMDDLPASFEALPMSEYIKILPEYDLFPEWISNWGYGNIQKHRNRMFMVGALKSEKFAFVPGEQEHDRVLKDEIPDLIGFENAEDVMNHANVNLDYIPGRYVNMDYYGHRPSWRELRDSNSFDHRANIPYATESGEVKHRPGTLSPAWDGYCNTLSGGFNPLHPLRRLPLSIRERARIQGFGDDFVFFHDTEGPDRKVWEPYNSDGQRGIKQTGKAMPLHFCNFVAAQVQAHCQGKKFKATGQRVIKDNDQVSKAKRDFAEQSGYANPEAVAKACWLDEPPEYYAEKKTKRSK